MNYRYDVAIVGGGPSGCIAASELARLGFKVCILERKSNQHSTEGFVELVSSEAKTELTRLTGSALFTGCCIMDRAIVKWTSGQVVITKYREPEKPVSVDRGELSSRLRFFVTHLGVDILYNTSVKHFNGNSVLTCIQNGIRITVEAPILVVASGRCGRRIVDSCTSIDKGSISISHGISVESEDANSEFVLESVGDRWWYLLPVSNTEKFLCVNNVRKHNNSWDKKQILDQLKETDLISRVIKNPIAKSIVFSRSESPLPRKSISGKGWVAIGDAAYPLHPLSGRGVDLAIWSSRLLASELQTHSFDCAQKNYTAAIENFVEQQEITKATYTYLK